MRYFPARLLIGLLLAFSIWSTSPVKAGDEAWSADHGGWQFEMAPYAFLPNITGDMTVAGNTVSLDLSIADLLDIAFDGGLNFVWTSYMEARRGRFSAYMDIYYIDVLIDQSLTLTNPPVGVAVSADYKSATVEGGVGYQIYKSSGDPIGLKDGGEMGGRMTSVDLIAGFRWWYQELGLNIDADGPGPEGISVARSGDIDWIDPIVGMRVRHQIDSKRSFNFKGDIGGFGVNSDFAWQLIATYNHEWRTTNGRTWSGMIGYRALSTDYSEGDFGYDLTQHGPVMGLSLKW